MILICHTGIPIRLHDVSEQPMTNADALDIVCHETLRLLYCLCLLKLQIYRGLKSCGENRHRWECLSEMNPFNICVYWLLKYNGVNAAKLPPGDFRPAVSLKRSSHHFAAILDERLFLIYKGPTPKNYSGNRTHHTVYTKEPYTRTDTNGPRSR